MVRGVMVRRVMVRAALMVAAARPVKLPVLLPSPDVAVLVLGRARVLTTCQLDHVWHAVVRSPRVVAPPSSDDLPLAPLAVHVGVHAIAHAEAQRRLVVRVDTVCSVVPDAREIVDLEVLIAGEVLPRRMDVASGGHICHQGRLLVLVHGHLALMEHLELVLLAAQGDDSTSQAQRKQEQRDPPPPIGLAIVVVVDRGGVVRVGGVDRHRDGARLIRGLRL
mmetsp:Transcript_40326/g.115857  ORF Transcript_40326/g.115857 Transcript_40326/m.115857 type:complete len:221 (+) Transcript_40326:537-1199(+)